MRRVPGLGRGAARAGVIVFLVIVLAFASGCLSRQLKATALWNATTLPDIQYQQVLDNLAMIASNPGYIPYLAVAGQGSVQVTDGGNSTLGVNLAPRSWTTAVLGLGATRNVTGTWSLGTVTSPEKIRAMQAAYQQAVDQAARGDAAGSWLHVGCRRDVPRDAPYVGRRGSTFAWVMPDGIAGLSDLTLVILDIATRDDSAPRPAHARETTGLPPVVRRNFQVPPSGPIYTPGAR